MLWYLLYIIVFYQQFAKLSAMHWFAEHSVHAAVDGSVNVLFLYVASHSIDFGLSWSFNVHGRVKLPYLLCCIIPIHKRHVTIHHYDWIFVRVVIINSLLDPTECLLSIVCKLSNLRSVLDAKYHHEPIDDITVKFFIINNQNLLVISHYRNWPFITDILLPTWSDNNIWKTWFMNKLNFFKDFLCSYHVCLFWR